MTRLAPRPKKSRGRRRRGAAVVEFALTVPILFLLVMGSIEFSRANMLIHTTSIAAVEAARVGIVPGATSQECYDAALAELNVVGITDATVEVNPTTMDNGTTQVTVNLTVPVNGENGYMIPRYFLGTSIFKSVTLQREGKYEDVNSEVTPTYPGGDDDDD